MPVNHDSHASPTPFLTAEWRHLVMLNFEVDPSLLQPLVPTGTELDGWRGQTFVSVVGFLFLNTRVLGIAIPFHRNFEEVNLRFYVRRRINDGWRRGVVFIKELVPRAAIALTARMIFGENYVALPMTHGIDPENGQSARKVFYGWTFNRRENRIDMQVHGGAREIDAGSEEEFIMEHYWGYSRRKDGSTFEYQVEHPRWRGWVADDARLECDAAELYGSQFAHALQASPAPAFLAEGSPVTVFKGVTLDVGEQH